MKEVTVDLRAAEGRALGQVFRDLTTRLVLTGETLRLDPVTLDLLGGRLTGRLVVDTSTAPTVVTLRAEVTGLDAAQLAALADASGAITGRLGGTLQLEAHADASGGLLATARGTAALAVTDGTLPGLDLVRPVITAFGVTGVLAPGTRAFSRLGGTFTLHRGILSSTDLALESDDVDLRGPGTVTLANPAIDLDADVVLSERLSAQAGLESFL